MKTIVWIGPERDIPGYGVGREGSSLLLPTDMADSYVDQGLAKEPTQYAKSKVVKTEEKD